LRRLYVDLVCGEGNSDGYAGVDSTLENGFLRTEKEDVQLHRQSKARGNDNSCFTTDETTATLYHGGDTFK
jgi:hypothetical protein